MRLGIWGAGNIGTGIAHRAMTSPFVSELCWINRDQRTLKKRVLDLEHGQSFSSSCRNIVACSQERAGDLLPGMDMTVLTQGKAVPLGGTRANLYPDNRRIFRDFAIPALGGIPGLVLVVSNPVDLLVRLVHREAGIDPRRVFGLGTVVETARLRRSLSCYFRRPRQAREVRSYAVGTHDKHFVPVMVEDDELAPLSWSLLNEVVAEELGRAAEGVKSEKVHTLHPIVEGVMSVIEAVGGDSGSTLTVSVLDPQTDDNLFYSVPCAVRGDGVDPDHDGPWRTEEVERGLARCRRELRSTLEFAGVS